MWKGREKERVARGGGLLPVLVCVCVYLLVVSYLFVLSLATLVTVIIQPETMLYIDAFNAFAGHLINHFIDANHTGNLVISPLSISTCLGMLLLGCRNNSSDQLIKLLKFPSRATSDATQDESIFKSYQIILQNLQTLDTKNVQDEMLLINKVLVRDSSILPSYRESLKEYFMASVEPLDPSASSKANAWVSRVTQGKIDSILDAPPDPLDQVILLNAIFFRGNWKYMFPKDKTHDAQFLVNGDPSNKKLVKMMSLVKTKLNFAEFMFEDPSNIGAKIGVQAVELPYEGSNSMLIFLPADQAEDTRRQTDPSGAVNSLVSSIQSLTSLIGQFDRDKKRREVNVHIPKFKFDQSFDLTDSLGTMGASDLIQSGYADLSGVDGTKNLYVSAVNHRAVIELSEEGTTAAASTGLVMTMRSFPFVTELYADRPFIFVIRDSTSKLISFVGKFSEP